MSTITTPDALPPLPPLPPMAWLAMNVLPRTVRVEVPSLWRAPPFASPTKPLTPPSPPIDRLPVNVLPMIVAVHPVLAVPDGAPLDVIELLLGDDLVAGEQAAPNGEDAVRTIDDGPAVSFRPIVGKDIVGYGQGPAVQNSPAPGTSVVTLTRVRPAMRDRQAGDGDGDAPR